MNKFNISHTCLKHEFKKIKQATSVNPSKKQRREGKRKKRAIVKFFENITFIQIKKINKNVSKEILVKVT